MDITTVILFIGIAIAISFVAAYFIFKYKKPNQAEENKTISNSPATQQLQLQAYERLALLADRIAIPNLISRLNQEGLGAKELQVILTQNIKSEFEYNISQQIYVSANTWKALKNLKDQNILLINQLGNVLPQTATGTDLSKLLLEYLMNDRKGSLQELVSEVISFEAKKLL